MHLVFVTRYRRDVLDQEMLTACEPVMRGLCAEMGADLREFNGEQNHVHPSARYPLRLTVSTLDNRLKAVSAHFLRKEFTNCVSPLLAHGHLWSPSQTASCGEAPLEIIKQYLEQQSDPVKPTRPRSSPSRNAAGYTGKLDLQVMG